MLSLGKVCGSGATFHARYVNSTSAAARIGCCRGLAAAGLRLQSSIRRNAARAIGTGNSDDACRQRFGFYPAANT